MSLRLLLMIGLWVLPLSAQELIGQYSVERLASGPVISGALFDRAGIPDDGLNINGPSLIKLPDWVAEEDRADPSARYYLYFAHHRGAYIRMAWAAEREGPFVLFNAGDLDVSAHPGRGVLDMALGGTPWRIDVVPPSDVSELDGVVLRGAGSWAHIASPQVLIDEQRRQFLMIFHASTGWGQQLSFLATSSDGLNFNMPADGGQAGHGIIGRPLGAAYLALSWLGDQVYGLANRGVLYQLASADFEDFLERRPALGREEPPKMLFEALGNPFWRAARAAGRLDAWRRGRQPRHGFLRSLPDGQVLEVINSWVGDAPERLLVSHLRPSGTQGTWRVSPGVGELLRSEHDWEGRQFPVLPSLDGSAVEVQQLRDPSLFLDEGRLFLLYSGAGEMAIGMAELIPLDAQSPQGTTLTGVDAYHR